MDLRVGLVLWLRKLGWVLLVGGASVGISVTFHSCDFSVQREAPGDQVAWRNVGVSSKTLEPLPGTDGSSTRRKAWSGVMIGGYAAMALGLLILIAVPSPPPWIVQEAKHRR